MIDLNQSDPFNRANQRRQKLHLTPRAVAYESDDVSNVGDGLSFDAFLEGSSEPMPEHDIAGLISFEKRLREIVSVIEHNSHDVARKRHDEKTVSNIAALKSGGKPGSTDDSKREAVAAARRLKSQAKLARKEHHESLQGLLRPIFEQAAKMIREHAHYIRENAQEAAADFGILISGGSLLAIELTGYSERLEDAATTPAGIGASAVGQLRAYGFHSLADTIEKEVSK